MEASLQAVEKPRQFFCVSLQPDAFRGHGLSRFVAALLQGLRLALFPLESPASASLVFLATQFKKTGVY
ncbi:MAG: hypothetical protein ACQEV0_14825 [Bacillota bacterium]